MKLWIRAAVAGLLALAVGLSPGAGLAQGGKDTPPGPPQPPVTIAAGDTLAEFSYFGGPVYPDGPVTVGTFMYTIPAGEVIVGATVLGQWGNSRSDSSAPTEVYVDGILVATCLITDPCYQGPAVPWSFTFDPADYPLLADGSAEMTVIQTGDFVVQLGETTLSIETAAAMPTLPSWALLALATALLVGALWFVARRRVAA